MTEAIGALAIAAAAAWLTAAAVGLGATRRVALVASAVVSGAGGLRGATCGVLLAVHGAGTTLGLGTGTVGGATFHIEPLAAPFIVLLGLVATAIALYAPHYHERGLGTAVYLSVYNLALVASISVLVAGNVVTFLVAWESMALLCYLVILRHHKREGVARGAFLFIALSECGFLLIVLAFAILATQTGSLTCRRSRRALAVCRPAGARPSTCSRSAASRSRPAWCLSISGCPPPTRSRPPTARRFSRAW